MAKSKGRKASELFQKTERRRQLILLVREHPDWTHQQLAKHLDCDRSTVCRDLSEINRDLKQMNSEAFLVHFQRILMEMQANKEMCLSMIRASQDKKDKEGKIVANGKGSRWMEEYTKIQMAEMKLLGLDKFDPTMAPEAKPFDKNQRDAAVDAAMKGIEMGFKAGIDTSKLLVNKDVSHELTNLSAEQPPAPVPPDATDCVTGDLREAPIGEPINREAI